MPTILPTTDFYAQHSPFGAFASFTLGRHGKKGGFGLELSGPARQDVYIAHVRSGSDGGVQAFPFYAGAQSSGAEAYTGEGEGGTFVSEQPSPGWTVYGADQITRSMGWASDRWTAGDLSFTLYTPFGDVPDPLTVDDDMLRRHLCPAIVAEITVDNTQGETDAFAFFGIGDADPLRALSDATGGALRGIARETHWGFAVVPKPEHSPGDVREVLSWDIQGAVAAQTGGEGPSPTLNRLASRGGILLRAAPGALRTYTLVLGFWRGGVATSGIAASYLYTRLFLSLEDVLAFAARSADGMKAQAQERDEELDSSPLSDERKFLLAHATHSYHGATMLLHDEKGDELLLSPRDSRHRPLWCVNEGEYRMLNTFDLTVDHAFWEIRYHPWTLRNTLDLFTKRYCYHDEVQDATDPKRPRHKGGISFTHDMGVANQFSPPGYSSYERPNLSECFSYMTAEQLANWCLCAALYALGGEREDIYWLALRRETLIACLHSLLHRDAPDDQLRSGILSLDSSRCGIGQEITTYDSLDASLGQARANVYLAVKMWAAYLALSRCFDKLGCENEAVTAEVQAARAAGSIIARFDADAGFLPAVMEAGSPGAESRILPAVEGLVFPYYLGDTDAVSDDGPYGEMVSLLRRHLETVLTPGVCLDAASGGFKISSTSQNTWMSKIFLSQFVAETVLGLPPVPEADATHARWQREGDCRDYAFTDQVRSTDGKDLGSRFYPRGVTAILWL
jgi:Glycosyl hydrolase family 52.